MTRKVVSRRLDILSYLLFLSTRARRKQAIVFQSTLATRFKVSLRTLIRDLNWLRDAGYLTWEHTEAAHGGFKCIFKLTDTGRGLVESPLFDIASDIPDASEKPPKLASQTCSDVGPVCGTFLQHNFKDNNNPVGPSSLGLKEEWKRWGEGMLLQAKAIGLSERQRQWLAKAARQYGTKAAWEALIRAAKRRRYATDCLDRVVWGMLRQAV